MDRGHPVRLSAQHTQFDQLSVQQEVRDPFE
jgi:hypothetical protein